MSFLKFFRGCPRQIPGDFNRLQWAAAGGCGLHFATAFPPKKAGRASPSHPLANKVGYAFNLLR